MPARPRAVAWFSAAGVPAIALAAALAENRDRMNIYLPGGVPTLAVALVLAAAAERYRGKGHRLLTAALAALASPLLLGILSFSLTGPEHVRNTAIFDVSFNTVYHSVVQVSFGRALLIDFVNQYGLFPHIIEPLLRLAGPGVYPFTALKGLLACLSFACFWRFLARETGDEPLAFLGLAAMVFFGYAAGRVAVPDLYFQYQPLRILFPALAVLFAHSFAHRPTTARAVGFSALGAFALLWNTDTGVVLLAAALLLPAYDALLRRRAREIPTRLLLGLAAAAGVFATWPLSFRLRYGALPDWRQLFVTPEAFYSYGASMLPMPRFGLLVPVVLVYAAALTTAAAALVQGEETPQARLYFFLPVLARGVFTYYQGRSVLSALMMAGYAAILLIALFADDLRRGTSPRRSASRERDTRTS